MTPYPPFVPPGAASTGAFLGIVAALCLGWVAAVARVRGRRTAVGFGLALAGWLAVTAGWSAALASSGSLALFLGFFLCSNGAGLVMASSPLGRDLAAGLPLAGLIGFQAFRLPLEVVLHQWAAEGAIPVEMTWDGRNLDVISGVVCGLAGGWLVWRPDDRAVAWAATGIGAVLLANVAWTAVNCSPVPFARFHPEPPLLLALAAPWSWIVPVCVASALAGHVLAVRSLLGR